jgi:hypothetical protein
MFFLILPLEILLFIKIAYDRKKINKTNLSF